MKSKSLLGMIQLAVMAAVGMTQMHQALPIVAKLAHRTAAPLEQMVRLGINPSYPRSPVPAVQPFAIATIDACDRAPAFDLWPAGAPVPHVRHTVVRVEAPRPMVETIASPITARVVRRRVSLAALANAQDIASIVQIRMNEAGMQREIATAQREMLRSMREAQRHQAGF
jgi:hypothetical protein